MTRPTVLDMDLVVVPREAAQVMLDDVTAADQHEPFSDTTMSGIFDSMLSASPYPTAWDDVRKYVEGLETEVERLKDELGDPDGVIAHANSITELFEARIAELEKKLSEADALIQSQQHDFAKNNIRNAENAHKVAELEKEKHAALTMIAMLEKRLADADRVIEPFADRAGKLDGIWKDHETQWSPEYGNTAITIGHLRAARAYMEGK